MYVLVAAIARSGPADRSSVQSARSASGEDGSLVSATVGAPWRRAASTTATMSGEAPDWLMARTRVRVSRGSAPYTDTTDGVASPTVSPFRTPSTYWA